MRNQLWRCVPILALLAASVAAAPPSGLGSQPQLTFEPCDLDGVAAEVDCGRLAVWEDRDLRQGRRLSVYFIRARATGARPAPDPIVILTGGPGEGASPGARQRLERLRPELDRRDVLIVDQRGTGRSSPLDCFSYDLEADPSGFSKLFERDFFDAEAFRTCLDELRGKADLTKYTTSWIADDIEDLRTALGYDRVNLSGGSYGTRLALEYIRRHPGSVRSAVLVGVAPSFALMVESVARDMEDALEALFRDCRADTACADAFPDFERQLRSVLARVRGEPVSVELPNPGTGRPEEVTLRYSQLVTALRYTLYSTQLSAALPLQVEAAAAGDFAPISGLLPAILPNLNNIAAEGLWASIKCTEEVRFLDLEKARELSSDTVLGTLRLDDEIDICKFWPTGEIADGFHEPVASEVPVLLIAGEYDPASPLRLAEQAAAHLARGTLVRVAQRSHWGLGGNDCLDGIVRAFLEQASGEGIDLSCAGGFSRPPFAMPPTAASGPR